MSSRASRYQKRHIHSDHDSDEVEEVTPKKKKPAARAPASETKKEKQAKAANVAAKNKAAASKLAAERLAAERLAADQQLAADADEALDDGNDPVDDGTLYAIVVEEEAKKPKEGDTRLWTSLQVSPDDPRNEPALDKLREYARYLKNGKLKPLEGKQLRYLTNAGSVADEDAEFKEYPVSADKKTWFKFFGGDVDKMLTDIENKSQLKVLLPEDERAKIQPELAVISTDGKWIRIIGDGYMLEAAGVVFDNIKTGNEHTKFKYMYTKDGHIKCYAAKCTVTMEDIADQLETMLDGSVIEIVIE